jgi:hypothetical protein
MTAEKQLVSASLWQLPAGDGATLFLINSSRDPVELTARLTAVECIDMRIVHPAVTLDGQSVSLTLPALTALAIGAR